MKGISGLLAVGLAMLATAAPGQTPVSEALQSAPHLTLNNGLIAVTVYPPGENAFYRGTRFDHAGVIGSLKLKGQEFYGPWFDATAPAVPDYRWTEAGIVAGPASAIMGPVEEFDPIGFDDTAPGGIFLKPGVGLLVRPDDKPYDHYRLYARAPGSETRTTTGNDSNVVMTQTVSGGGFGYVYEKTLALVPGKPQLVIGHVLRNTGTKPIVTSVYDHNFITLNPGQGDMTVTLPFAPSAPPPQSRLAVESRAIHWPQALIEGQTGAMTISDMPRVYDFTVTDARNGASVRAQADRPASQIRLWSIKSVMAVEPYIALDVPPGAEMRWTYTYTYSAP